MEPNPSGTEPVERLSLFASARRLDAQRQRDQARDLYQKSKAVWEEAARSGEADRSVFEDGPEPALRISGAQALKGLFHRSRMVGEIVDDRHPFGLCNYFLSASNALEGSKTLGHFHNGQPIEIQSWLGRTRFSVTT